MKQFLTTSFLLCLFTAAFSQANTKLSNLVSPTAVNQHLLPNSNNARDLGSTSLNWRSFYLKGSMWKGSQRFLSNSGIGNTFLGIQSGKSNTSGAHNTIIGDSALFTNTTGGYNTSIGVFSLYKNTSGNNNTAAGGVALYSNTTGINNTANGVQALYLNTTGSANTATGYDALFSNSTGEFNTANGQEALYHNAGSYNTALGFRSLFSNTSYDNTATGSYALYSNTTGLDNTANGFYALYSNATGASNVAVGSGALYWNTQSYNTAVGYSTLYKTLNSQYNTAVGYLAGSAHFNGYNNVFLGANTDVNGDDYYNVIAIGQQTVCTAPSQVTIGNGATNSYRAYANWSNISDGRYKKNIKEDVPGLSFINKLRPVTYTLDASGLDAFLNKGRTKENSMSSQAKVIMDKALKEKEAVVQTGFVAQEVEKAAKESSYNFSGVDAPKNSNDVYALRYSDFVVPLVKAVQELSKQNEDLKKQVTELRQMVLDLKNGTPLTTSTYLHQNTPNPADVSTHISYSLPANIGQAQLLLSDAAGKTIRTIPLKGSGTVEVSTAALSSGVYNYSLLVDGKIADTKKMAVTR